MREKLSAEKINSIYQLRGAGKSYAEIAEELKVAFGSVHKYLHLNNGENSKNVVSTDSKEKVNEEYNKKITLTTAGIRKLLKGKEVRINGFVIARRVISHKETIRQLKCKIYGLRHQLKRIRESK